MNCPICKFKLSKVLDLGSHPLCDDLKKIKDHSKNKLYRIIILYCDNCCTAFQKYNVDRHPLKSIQPYKKNDTLSIIATHNIKFIRYCTISIVQILIGIFL